MNQKGFTLIELLVVISIIAILSTIGIMTYQGVTGKARDSIRKQDLNTLATALEIYSQRNNGDYVEAITICQTDPDPNFNTFYNAIKTYLSDQNNLPKDPLTKLAYCYISDSGGYRLFAKLENCQGSSGNLCEGLNYNYSIYSEDLTTLELPP